MTHTHTHKNNMHDFEFNFKYIYRVAFRCQTKSNSVTFNRRAHFFFVIQESIRIQIRKKNQIKQNNLTIIIPRE